MPLNQRSRRLVFLCLLLLAFLFRLGFGLCSQFQDEDTKQIYLLGLKFYATGAWPYFGPDVTPTIQIPGALQGLVVGLPFHLLPIPEAPYVFLNILSFVSLCFFAWYCGKRLPEIPKWFLWSWLLTAPWTLNLSTHIYNPSYVLPGAILFFVGAIETYPGDFALLDNAISLVVGGAGSLRRCFLLLSIPQGRPQGFILLRMVRRRRAYHRQLSSSHVHQVWTGGGNGQHKRDCGT